VTSPAARQVTCPTVARGLSKRYGLRGAWVLDQVDLDLQPGTLTVVAGANGCGKSTLLRVLAGISHANMGAVVQRPHSVGYVPERLASRMPMTGRAYLGHMGRLHGLEAGYASRRAEQLAGRLALRPGLDAPISSLSKGNRQKVALAQALLAPVGLLLLDEPWSGLDPAAAEGLSLEIASARQQATTVLVTAHRADATAGADRALELVGGELRALGRGHEEPRGTGRMVAELAPPADLAGAFVAPAWMAALNPTFAEGRWRFVLQAEGALDQLLTRALSEGWSVRLVAPVAPDGHLEVADGGQGRRC